VGIFREVDNDRSGFIDLDEFVTAMRMLGLEISLEGVCGGGRWLDGLG
jgi:Ca2+-binding EF-hand superfamily protein